MTAGASGTPSTDISRIYGSRRTAHVYYVIVRPLVATLARGYGIEVAERMVDQIKIEQFESAAVMSATARCTPVLLNGQVDRRPRSGSSRWSIRDIEVDGRASNAATMMVTP